MIDNLCVIQGSSALFRVRSLSIRFRAYIVHFEIPFHQQKKGVIFGAHHFFHKMTRSQWICNTCGDDFETKGKRDGHRERIHRQTILISAEEKGIKRSENGNFTCKCGKNYRWPRSLQRHQKNCEEKFVSNEMINDGIGRGI
jgi:hypothetical protein